MKMPEFRKVYTRFPSRNYEVQKGTRNCMSFVKDWKRSPRMALSVRLTATDLRDNPENPFPLY